MRASPTSLAIRARRDAAYGRARRCARHRLCARPSGGDRGRHGRRLGLATGRTAFVNLHAMGGLGNAMGVLVASKASETPLVVTAGQQDTRHLMTEPWLSGARCARCARDQMGEGAARGDDVGPALRRAFVLRTPPCGPVFLSLPMDILDQDVNHPTPPASSPPRLGPSPDAARLAETLATLDPGSGRRPARRRPAGGRERWPRGFAEAGGFPVWALSSHRAPRFRPCIPRGLAC